MDDILINFGSEIKAIGENKIGGLLVRYSTKDKPDLAGDYFDENTDFGFEDSIKTPVWFNHRLPIETPDGKQITIREKIGQGTLTKSKDGVLIEAILYNREKYEKALSAMGWSSGTSQHTSDRTKTGKSFHIDTWILGVDASVTPTPCDPDNVCTLKSYQGGAVKFASLEEEETTTPPTFKPTALASRLTKHIEDMSDGGKSEAEILASLADESGKDLAYVGAIISGSVSRPSDATLKAFARVLDVSFEVLREAAERDGAKTIKGMFEAAVDVESLKVYPLFSTYSQVLSKVANVARDSRQIGDVFDTELRVKEATDLFAKHLLSIAVREVDGYAESNEPDKDFSLKAIIDPSNDPLATETVDLEDHSQLVESALKGLSKRYWKNFQNRIKAGRTFSERSRSQITARIETIESELASLRELLSQSQPMATEEEKNAAQIEYLRLQRRISRLGATTNGKEITGVVDGNSDQE